MGAKINSLCCDGVTEPAALACFVEVDYQIYQEGRLCGLVSSPATSLASLPLLLRFIFEQRNWVFHIFKNDYLMAPSRCPYE